MVVESGFVDDELPSLPVVVVESGLVDVVVGSGQAVVGVDASVAPTSVTLAFLPVVGGEVDVDVDVDVGAQAPAAGSPAGESAPAVA